MVRPGIFLVLLVDPPRDFPLDLVKRAAPCWRFTPVPALMAALDKTHLRFDLFDLKVEKRVC